MKNTNTKSLTPELANIDPALAGASIHKHMASPDVRLDRHIKSRQLELAASVAHRKAIYLDVCFWIRLRDSVRNPDCQEDAALLAALRQAVATDMAFCPISDSTLLELFKQTDPDSRQGTARLIDDLSVGASFMPYAPRVGTEIAHFLHSSLDLPVHPLRNLVWSKLSYVMGFVHPVHGGMGDATQLALQKAFFDHLWDTVTMERMCLQLGEGFVHADPLRHESSTAKLNAGIQEHAASLRSFQQAYRDELVGVLDLFAGAAADIIGNMRPAGMEPPPAPGSMERAEIDRQCLSLLVAACGKERGRQALRSVHIAATMHAAVRWNKTQKFKPNDLFDFEHAYAAVGYCHAFFTERPLATLLTRPSLGLTKDFPCFVTSERAQALDYVRGLMR